jgi:hypothetical protein
VQAVKRSVVLLALPALVAAAALLLPALPASAANGPPPSVGCPTGSSCQVQLYQFVNFNGQTSNGGGNQVVVPPPACLWNPLGNATTGSKAVIALVKANTVGNGVAAANNQAEQLLTQNPPPAGEWYQLALNLSAPAAEQAQCNAMPLFEFLKPDTAPAGFSLPPGTLAQLAYAVLETPKISKIQLNPAGNNETNLPTFVKAQLISSGLGTLGSVDGRPYVAVTAALNGTSATVWAISTGLVINSGAPSSGATTYSDCNNVAADKLGLLLGTDATSAEMSQTQANQPIDCGVTYRQPGTFDLQVSLRWTACWANTGGVTLPPPPPTNLNDCQAVPGAGNLQPRYNNADVNVGEIQSVNG